MALASLSEVTPSNNSTFVQIGKNTLLPHDTLQLENCQNECPIHNVYHVNGSRKQLHRATLPLPTPRPHLVNIPDATAVPRHVETTVAGTQFALDAEEQHLQVSLLLKPEGALAQEPGRHTSTCCPPA